MLLTDRRDGTMAALLSTIVLMFLACHSTKIIVNFYEAIQVKYSKKLPTFLTHPSRIFLFKMVRHGERVHPTWVMMLVKVNHLLLTINSATNILLYSYKVQYFGPLPPHLYIRFGWVLQDHKFAAPFLF